MAEEKERSFFMRLKKFARLAVFPVSANEDARRREFILNILLLASITLLTIAMVSSVISSIHASPESHANDTMPLIALAAVLFTFFGLYLLSIRGHARAASYVFIGIFFLLSVYLAYVWGPDLPSAILFYALTIVMSGILIDSRFAFIVTLLLAASASLINHLDNVGALAINAYWRTEHLTFADTVVYGVMLLIIATVSWLSNREIERSLQRARRSEAMLMEERDLLEIRVHERTEALRKAEIEKMNQAYRFVEFGRLASGLFHDLSNPLTALSLNIESIARSHGTNDPEQVALLSEDVARARSATIHMQKLMESMRRYLAHEGVRELFSVDRSLEEITHVLEPYARQKNVRLSLQISEKVSVMGDPVAFVQILTNIISNAVESFPHMEEYGKEHERLVSITLANESDGVSICVRDSGAGIAEESLAMIFEPFYSTKGTSGGLGIGLSLAKRIVEREFAGTIAVASVAGEGSAFTVYFPMREP